MRIVGKMKFFSREKEKETPKEILNELQKNLKTPVPHTEWPVPQEKIVVEEKTIEQQVIKVLKTIYDPEIPVNIYALGLIYNIDISEDKDIEVEMTLTSPACPVAETLPPMIERALMVNIKEAQSAAVTVVWEPPWTVDRMTEDVKLELGMF